MDKAMAVGKLSVGKFIALFVASTVITLVSFQFFSKQYRKGMNRMAANKAADTVESITSELGANAAASTEAFRRVATRVSNLQPRGSYIGLDGQRNEIAQFKGVK